MSTQHSKDRHLEEKEASHEQQKGKSLAETSAELRKESGASAFSIDVRVNSADIIDAIPGSDKISEVTGEDKNRKGDPAAQSSSQSSAQDDDSLINIEEIKIPEKKAMVRKVRIAIQHEIEETKKQIRKYENHPTKKAFELSEAVDLLRKLYALLQEIAYKSSEFVKNIWMDVFQGKKISEILENRH